MNYIKNRVALCLSVALVLSALSSEITRAAEIVRQWNYSDADDGTIVATLIDDGLMVIEGSGYCNPPGDNNFWKGWNQLGYGDAIKEAVYGEGILGAGPTAFYRCRNLSKVTLPSTLRKIETSAFTGTGIQEITIPDSVSKIEDRAFSQCKQLENIELPVSLKNLGDSVFDNCNELQEVIIDSPKLELIASRTFYNCNNLRSVKIGGGLKTIKYGAFSSCENLESIDLPEGLEYIAEAFDDCHRLTDIIIPRSVTYIDPYAFKDVPGPIGVYCGSYALRRCKEKGWPYYIVDAEENKPEILDDLQYEYYKDVAASIQIPVHMNSATKLTQVRINDTEIPTDTYDVENGIIVISSDYLNTLGADKYSVFMSFNDCAKTTLSAKLYVYEKAADREAPYLIQDTVKFEGSDIDFKFNPGKGDLKTTNVLSLVVDDTIILPDGSTLPFTRTNVRDIIAAYEASLDLDEPFIEEISEDVTLATPSEPIYYATPSEPIKVASVSKPCKLSKKEKRAHQLSTLLAAITNGSDTVFWVDGNTITLSGEYITNMSLPDGNHLIGAIFDNMEKTTDLKKVVLIIGEPEEPPVPEEPDVPNKPADPERPSEPDKPTDPETPDRPEDQNKPNDPPVIDKPNEPHRPTRPNVSIGGGSASSSNKRPSNNKPTLDNGSINSNFKPILPDSGGEFKGSGNEWEYVKPDGTYANNEWVVSGGDWYYVGNDGKLEYGWLLDSTSGSWYMLNEEHNGKFGAAKIGWYLERQDNKWYFFNPSDNAMMTSWQFIDGKWYYFTEHNSAPTYSGNNTSGWSYTPTIETRPYGSMYCSESTPDNHIVDSTGARIQ